MIFVIKELKLSFLILNDALFLIYLFIVFDIKKMREIKSVWKVFLIAIWIF